MPTAPDHWQLNRIGRIGSCGMGQTILREMLDEEPDENSLPVFSASEGEDVFGFLRSPKVVLKPGDMIIGARGSIGFVRKVRIPSTCTQTTIWLRPDEAINQDYLYWYLTGLREQLFPFDKTAIPMLTVEQVRSGPLLIPLISEQRCIASFLDRETSKIDSLIDEQKRLIDLLKEKRQAVISHAVTKGLNPDAPMKDSEIEWLGTVPAHWKIRRLKRLSPQITVGIVVNPSNYVSDDGLPFIYGGDITEGTINLDTCRRISAEHSDQNRKTQLHEGDLLTVRVGAPGVTAVVTKECEGGNCASVMLIRRGDFSSKWLCYAMNSRILRFQVEVVQYGAAQEQFNISHAVDFVIPTPPLDEQNEIAMKLEEAVSVINNLASEADRSISLLQERRSALITAAVTGKIDVRGLVMGIAKAEVEAA